MKTYLLEDHVVRDLDALGLLDLAKDDRTTLACGRLRRRRAVWVGAIADYHADAIVEGPRPTGRVPMNVNTLSNCTNGAKARGCGRIVPLAAVTAAVVRLPFGRDPRRIAMRLRVDGRALQHDRELQQPEADRLCIGSSVLETSTEAR